MGKHLYRRDIRCKNKEVGKHSSYRRRDDGSVNMGGILLCYLAILVFGLASIICPGILAAQRGASFVRIWIVGRRTRRHRWRADLLVAGVSTGWRCWHDPRMRGESPFVGNRSILGCAAERFNFRWIARVCGYRRDARGIAIVGRRLGLGIAGRIRLSVDGDRCSLSGSGQSVSRFGKHRNGGVPAVACIFPRDFCRNKNKKSCTASHPFDALIVPPLSFCTQGRGAGVKG